MDGSLAFGANGAVPGSAGSALSAFHEESWTRLERTCSGPSEASGIRLHGHVELFHEVLTAVKRLSCKVEMLEAKMDIRHQELGDKLESLEAKVKTYHQELLQKLTTSCFAIECSGLNKEVSPGSFQAVHQDDLKARAATEKESWTDARIAKLESFVEQMKQEKMPLAWQKTHVSFKVQWTYDYSVYQIFHNVPLSTTPRQLLPEVGKAFRTQVVKNQEELDQCLDKEPLLMLDGFNLNLFPDTPLADLGVQEFSKMWLTSEYGFQN